MSIIRQFNWLAQERIDVPFLRSVESSIAHDFDLLAGKIMAGEQPLVARSFALITSSIIGASADTVTLDVENGLLVHYLATDSGSIFEVPSGRTSEVLNSSNPRVTGSFTANAVNYVGVDLVRSIDDNSADVAMFLNADSGEETLEIVPLAKTFDYIINIGVNDFDSNPNLCPLYKITTDSAGNVTAYQDARNIFWRLGKGGTVPDVMNTYGWPGGRSEAASVTLAEVGGDRSIENMKDWMDAVMSRLWEVGGGEYWYSATADRNVRMVSSSVFTSSGEPFEIVSSNIHWKGLKFVFDNSIGYYNDIADQLTSVAGLTDLATGECLYVDIDRSTNRTGGTALVAQKGVLSSLGSPSVPGSRFVIAWNNSGTFYTRDQYLPIGSALRAATTSVLGTVVLSATPSNPSAPVVASTFTQSGVTLVAGIGGMSRIATGTVGDLRIGFGYNGSGFNDQNVIIYTNSSSGDYNVSIQSNANFGLVSKPALSVQQNNASLNAMILGLMSGSTLKHTLLVENDGAIILANCAAAPATPAPSPGPPNYNPGRLKIYAITNGVASPGTRDQVFIKWWDGSTTMLGQSPTY